MGGTFALVRQFNQVTLRALSTLVSPLPVAGEKGQPDGCGERALSDAAGDDG